MKKPVENFEKLIEVLEDNLPHGSGIDYDWTFKVQKNFKVIASNSFHTMDECGFYCCVVPFDVKLNRDNYKWIVESITVHKNNCKLCCQEMLKDYLWDTIPYSLENI